MSVPQNPTAKLMYYFNCICTCVEANEDASIRRLQDYRNYASLSRTDEAQLLILCLALSPDKLIGSILFPAEDIDLDGFTNQFYELSAINTRLVVAESILIGGQQKRVRKIMMFKKSWIETYYINPLLSFERQASQRRALPSTRPAAAFNQPPPRAPPSAFTPPRPSPAASRPINSHITPAASSYNRLAATNTPAASNYNRPAATNPNPARKVAPNPPRANVTSRPAASSSYIRPAASNPPLRSNPPSRKEKKKSSCSIM